MPFPLPLRAQLLTAMALTATLARPARLDSQTAERPDTVSLRFGWPVGMAARVTNTMIRVQTTSARRDSTGITAEYDLTVEPHARGRLIRAAGFRLPASVAGSAGLQEGIAALALLHPSFVVDDEGTLVALENVETLRSMIDSLMAPLRADSAKLPPPLRAMLANLTSDETMLGLAAQGWNATVGAWVGADWELGAVYELEQEEPLPLMPDATILMRYEFAAAERVPCEEGAAEARCVRLELLSEADTAALRAFTTTLVVGADPAMREVAQALGSMRTANTVTAIAEPRTLRPYLVEWTKHIEVAATPTATDAGGQMRRVDRRIMRYRYPVRR